MTEEKEEKINKEEEIEKEASAQEEEKKENSEEVLDERDQKIKELERELEQVKADLRKTHKEVSDWTNKYYSVYADMANTRKEIERENQDFKKYARQSVIEEFIPVLDSFDMALKNEPQDETIKKYLQGFKMIHSKLLNSFVQLGVTIIDPKVGDEYDPHKMEAFSTVEAEEGNKIADVFLKGYMIHDHLLRPAGVIITTKAAPKKEDVKTKEAEEASEEEKKD